jgi:uncharacterized protein (DUF2384 family)
VEGYHYGVGMVTVGHDIATPVEDSFWQERAVPLLGELDEATQRLASSKVVDPEVHTAVHHLAETFSVIDPSRLERGDPYLVEALLVGVVGCMKALWLGDDEKQRRELRAPLERSRQALRDLLAERHVSDERPAKEVIRWVVDVSKVPQHDIAELIRVNPRTLQRWISPSESAAPSGEEELRVRVLARTIDQLRWSMTPAGVLRWLRKPHPMLNGRAPVDLLDEPVAYSELPRLAAQTRAMVSS